jgi:hypothetical protein
MSITDSINEVMPASQFMSGKEFDGEGLILKVAKQPELVAASGPKFGYPEGHPHHGKTTRWYFVHNDEERYFDNTSGRLLNAMTDADLSEGDMIQVQRSGLGTDTQWSVKKLTE